MKSQQKLVLVILFLLFGGICLYTGSKLPSWFTTQLHSPFVKSETPDPRLLDAYTIPALRETAITASPITLGAVLTAPQTLKTNLFYFSPLHKKMSGQIIFPEVITADTPVIVLVRGYVPHEIFESGIGTRPAATVFAQNGYITIAPDFFGYGESDPEPEDTWQARFEKPLIVLELIQSISEYGIPVDAAGTLHKTDRVGIWAHSNGGQIALSALTTTKKQIPTTLWAPVTAPFPYSILFFSDEDADEGHAARLWVNQLEKKYDVRKFSFTNYLEWLQGPLQIHHGDADEAALKTWSDEFVQKIQKQNKGRENPVDVTYYTYPGADHNVTPKQNWNTAITRDLQFFEKNIK